MRTKQAAPKDIDDYIAGFPDDVQEILQKIRMTIKKAAPDAVERISYQIPSFSLEGRYLVYFAAFKDHVSVYPAPPGSGELQEELSPYRSGKGTVKFQLDKPIPWNLITKIVSFWVEENRRKAEARRKKKTS